MELLFILFITIGLSLKIMFLALNLILPKKQWYYNDIINLDEFDGSKIKVDKKNLMALIFIILDMNIRKKLQNVM